MHTASLLLLKSLHLSTVREFEQAKHLYNKQGFSDVKSEQISDGCTLYYMCKQMAT